MKSILHCPKIIRNEKALDACSQCCVHCKYEGHISRQLQVSSSIYFVLPPQFTTLLNVLNIFQVFPLSLSENVIIICWLD